MSIRNHEDRANKHLSPLARNTISILGQTIGHIKRHDSEARIFQILTQAITMLTSILKPYIKDNPMVDMNTGEIIDDRLKN